MGTIFRMKDGAALRRKWASVPGVVFPVEQPREVVVEERPKKVRAKVAAEPLGAPEGWMTTNEACTVLGRARLSTLARLREAKVRSRVSRVKNARGFLWKKAEVLALAERLGVLPLLSEADVGSAMMLSEAAKRLGLSPSIVSKRMRRLGIVGRRVLVRRADGQVSKCQLLTLEQVEAVAQAARSSLV